MTTLTVIGPGGGCTCPGFGDLSRTVQGMYRDQARAKLAALREWAEASR